MVVSPLPKLAACRTCGESFADDLLVCPVDGAALPLEGRLLDGKFRLDRRLGQGGMASVWQATNVFVERTVAIKLMHASYAEDADLLARFRNEATAAGRIGSPHICDVLDFGRSAIGPYIVMELLSGCSLSDLIEHYGRLQPGLAVWIVRQALDGLHAAHQAGIIHRDLKPENIHLCRAIRDQWLVKLMDFGISKFNDSIRTGAGTMMGSPNYMAPEQIHGAGAVDRRADVWSIGAILYEALAGTQAFARDTVADSLAAVRGYDPPPLHTLAPEVPLGLSEIVARCLRKQPDQRWPSAAALAEALLPFERPGPRARMQPITPIADFHPVDTLPRLGAVPQALTEAEPAPVPNARSQPAAPGPVTRPSGGFPPVASAISGAHPALPSQPVPKTISGAHPPLPRGSAAAAQPVPKNISGAHPSLPRTTTGAHLPVPKKITGAQQPVARPVTGGQQPVARPVTGGQQPVARPVTGGQQPVPKAGPGQPGPRVAPASPVSSARSRAPAGASDPHPLLVFAVLAAIGTVAAAIAWFAL
ncbi:serine/threonine-protein kinase [Nannocystis bainbridge]|uniref:Protein kinase n=1 Tax=Nannocystis bainbridge TaxID=2995303 RepID=A0ABT5E0N9_9BACT|nr:serine/threonine protein kinase [Nannocystis bainbridge]MDC0719456.1 protein kinase [Nannocystis bainbridge]